MSVSDDVASYIDQSRGDLLQFCSALVQCPTENPPGTTTSAIETITAQLTAWGIDSKVVGPRADAQNIIATITGNGAGPHLVFNGHMDVFPAGDRDLWSGDPFSGEVVDGRLYGRGAGDMKGGLSASLWAFGALATHRDAWPGRVTFTAVSEEEKLAAAGAPYLVENHADEVLGDALLDGEPSGPEFIYGGSKGVLWLKIRVTAKGGHSAQPHMGSSATREMLPLLATLSERIEGLPCPVSPDVQRRILDAKETIDELDGSGGADALLRLTTNVGVIHGGLAVNMMAETCEAEFDIRYPPGGVKEDLLSIVAETVNAHPGAVFEVMNDIAPSICDLDAPIFAAVKSAAETVLGVSPITVLSHPVGDDRLWRWAGVPGATYGPRGYNVGGADEYITVDELIGIAKIHARAGASFLTS